jgi:hypothetical protein
MIDLWPRWAIPSWVCGESRKNFCLAASGIALLVLAVAVPKEVIFGNEEKNYLVSLFSSLRNMVHPQSFPCPFCGGTRAFLLCSDLSFMKAASYSFPAIIVFVSMCATTPLRLILLMPKAGTRFVKLRKTLDFHDRTTLQIAVLLVAWALQLVLHFTEFFPSVVLNEFEWFGVPLG